MVFGVAFHNYFSANIAAIAAVRVAVRRQLGSPQLDRVVLASCPLFASADMVRHARPSGSLREGRPPSRQETIQRIIPIELLTHMDRRSREHGSLTNGFEISLSYPQVFHTAVHNNYSRNQVSSRLYSAIVPIHHGRHAECVGVTCHGLSKFALNGAVSLDTSFRRHLRARRARGGRAVVLPSGYWRGVPSRKGHDVVQSMVGRP